MRRPLKGGQPPGSAWHQGRRPPATRRGPLAIGEQLLGHPKANSPRELQIASSYTVSLRGQLTDLGHPAPSGHRIGCPAIE